MHCWLEQGSDLWKRFSRSFGYLNKQGYCTGSNTLGSPSGTCYKFPVIFGEIGTDFHVRKHVVLLWLLFLPCMLCHACAATQTWSRCLHPHGRCHYQLSYAMLC